jgi:DNA-binding transcriptional LysR family regulator
MLSSKNKQSLLCIGLMSTASLCPVELRQLEHFVAVAEETSFTRAAARVYVGQSAVSVSIRTLERELGARLFERTTHQVLLTDAGTALYGEARRTLVAADAARDAVAAVLGVVRGTLRVGVMQSLKPVDLASLLARFRADHPGVDLYLRPALGGSASLADATRDGELDLAFVSLRAGETAGLSTTLLASEPLFVVGSPTTLSRGRAALGIADLADAAFVDFPEGWGTRAIADQVFATGSGHRRVTIEVADVSTFLDLVRAGLGLGLLPRSLVPHDRRLIVRRFSPEPTWDIMLVQAEERAASAAAKAFVSLVLAEIGPELPLRPEFTS